MKCSVLQTWIILLIILISKYSGKKAAPKDEDVISDKELDELLKDPKYAGLAGDLAGKGGVASLMLPTGDKKVSNLGSSKQASLADPLADLGMTSADLVALEPKKPQPVKKEVKKEDDKFKDFDFLSKQQARLLIEVLKQPVFFNMLPPEAQQVVTVYLF